MNNFFEETSRSQLHFISANHEKVKLSGRNEAHVQNELESGSSHDGSDFDPSVDSGCSEDGSDFSQSIDSSRSETPPPPNVSSKMLQKQKSDVIKMVAFREAERIHVRDDVATRFRPESASVKLDYLVPTAITCLCDDDSCEKRVRAGNFATLGKGSWERPHCEHFCTTADSKETRYTRPFPSQADFERHLKTTACRKSRGLGPTGPSARKLISDRVA